MLMLRSGLQSRWTPALFAVVSQRSGRCWNAVFLPVLNQQWRARPFLHRPGRSRALQRAALWITERWSILTQRTPPQGVPTPLLRNSTWKNLFHRHHHSEIIAPRTGFGTRGQVDEKSFGDEGMNGWMDEGMNGWRDGSQPRAPSRP
jgi:hypothetical protein